MARMRSTGSATASPRRAAVRLGLAAVLLLALAAAAHAQSGGDEPSLDQRLRLHQLLKTPDPTKDVVVPTETERQQEEVRRAQERARHAGPGAQPQRGPGYIGPLSTETSTGRMGVSGWTSPAITTPGSGGTPEEKAGQLGFGFSVEWGGSRRPAAEAP